MSQRKNAMVGKYDFDLCRCAASSFQPSI
jgi:hypothetical protein